MNKLAAVCLSASIMLVTHAQTRTLTWCAQDGETFSIKDPPGTTFIAYVGSHGDELRAQYIGEDTTFSLYREEQMLDKFDIRDLLNPNGWLTRSEGGDRFAIAWSNGGAAGGWSTRIFTVSTEGKFVDSAAIRMIEKDFSANHNCVTRGNNYMAVRWLDADRLLVDAEVYPTSDCGKQMGFSMGYIVDVARHVIDQKLSYEQMIHLPLVCTQNNMLRP